MAVNVELGTTLEAYVADLVEAGRYESMNDVLRESVRLLQHREAELAQLDAALASGLADIKAGRLRPAEEVFDRLRAKYGTSSERTAKP